MALTRALPESIDVLLSSARDSCPPQAARTAVFYSISNCQDGLRGVPFGSHLIKQVVQSLKAELPRLQTFVTLSPLPGLSAWAKTQIDDAVLGEAAQSAFAGRAGPEPLAQLAATYLLRARSPVGEVLDPVARFHLGNGASVLRIRQNADLSDKARRQSFGLMVHYLYDLKLLERNRNALITRGEVPAGRRIRSLARRGGDAIGRASA